MDNEKLKTFCNNYEVKVVNDTQRYARYRPPTFFTDPERADIIRNDLEDVRTEKLYTVQIPESRLQSLIELETRFYNHRNSEGMRDIFETLMDKEREEAHYRHTNAAVQKAYEQYSMLLNLAGYQRKF
jgi:hypothetical protein